MSQRKALPSYRLHKQSGQAIVTLPDGFGGRRDILLGKYDTAESRAEYVRVLSEWEATGRRLVASEPASDLTVNEVILAFYRHVEQNYRLPDGTPTREVDNVKDALRPLRDLYGPSPAKNFGPKALKAVRQQMIDQGLCRNTINRRIGRIKSMFRWAESEELLPPSTLHALQTVRGLSKGRSLARETDPVRPVPPEVVKITLPFMLPVVSDMVRLQQLTGMRPGELVIMRPVDIEMAGAVWFYRPGSDRGNCGMHKTAHHGHHRIIAIGPRGQEIVRKYVDVDLHAFLFSPRAAMQARRAEKRRTRKTKVQPSQHTRRKRCPKRMPGNRYRVGSYATAIRRAVQAANRTRICKACKSAERLCEGCQTNRVPHWHPHQLRHTKATEIRREAGLDAARVVLGHRSPQITETYAEIDVGKAAEVMARLG